MSAAEQPNLFDFPASPPAQNRDELAQARADLARELKRMRWLDAVAAATIAKSVAVIERHAAFGRSRYAVKDVDPSKTAGHAAAILELLAKRGPAGALNTELNKICFRYGGRIFDLRHAGHQIQSINEGGGVWRFVLC